MRAILAFGLLLVTAQPAIAGSYSVPAPVVDTEEFAGKGTVALAAGRVAWLEQRGTGMALVAAGEDAGPHDVATLPPVAGSKRFHHVVASCSTASSSATCARTRPVARLPPPT